MPDEIIVRDPEEPSKKRSAPPAYLSLSLSDIGEVGRVFATSGFFKDARGEAQAITKIIFGQELGLKPGEAMTNIHVFDGKVTLGGTLIARLIKQSERYDYDQEQDEQGCTITIHEKSKRTGEWGVAGSASFTMEDAETANLLRKDNWLKYPADMLHARAIARAARRYCPDAFGGSIYVPDELDTAQPTPAQVYQERQEGQAAALAALEQAPAPPEQAEPELPAEPQAESKKIADRVLAGSPSPQPAKEDAAGATAEKKPRRGAASKKGGGDATTLTVPTTVVADPPPDLLTPEPAAAEPEPPPAEPEPSELEQRFDKAAATLQRIVGDERFTAGLASIYTQVGVVDAPPSAEQYEQVVTLLETQADIYSEEATA